MQATKPLLRSNPLLSDSQSTSASWIRWIAYGWKNARSSSSVRHSRSRLSDLWDSQSNANPITVQCKKCNWDCTKRPPQFLQSSNAKNARQLPSSVGSTGSWRNMTVREWYRMKPIEIQWNCLRSKHSWLRSVVLAKMAWIQIMFSSLPEASSSVQCSLVYEIDCFLQYFFFQRIWLQVALKIRTKTQGDSMIKTAKKVYKRICDTAHRSQLVQTHGLRV